MDALLASAAMGLAGKGMGALGGLANAQNSYSNGSSWNISKDRSNNVSDQASWEHNMNQSMSNVYGTQATAQDIINADKANALNYGFMQAQQAYNSKEAALNRAFQAEMSNTSYQRAVQDLRKAGLNPILAALNMGASTPAGSVATSGLQMSHKANSYADQESYSYGEGAGGSTGHSEGSSTGFSTGKSKNSSKTETQLKSLINSFGEIGGTVASEAAKGAISGISRVGAVQKAFNNLTSGWKTNTK